MAGGVRLIYKDTLVLVDCVHVWPRARVVCMHARMRERESTKLVSISKEQD